MEDKGLTDFGLVGFLVYKGVPIMETRNFNGQVFFYFPESPQTGELIKKYYRHEEPVDPCGYNQAIKDKILYRLIVLGVG